MLSASITQHQRDVAVDAVVVYRLFKRRLIRDTPADILIAQAADRVGQPCPGAGSVVHLNRGLARHRVFYVLYDLFPGAQL